MLRKLVVILLFFTLGTCDANNSLALPVPGYATFEEKGIIRYVLYSAFYTAIGLFGLLPIPELSVYQVIALTTLSCALFTRHIVFDWLLPSMLTSYMTYVIFIIQCLVALGVAFLSLNVKFRHLFGAVGSGYIMAYELVIIFAISSFSIGVILLLALIGGMIMVGKFNDFFLNCFIRAALVPFCFLLSVNALIMQVFLEMHSKATSSIVSFPIAVSLGLGVVLCFIIVFFQREIKKKVEKLATNVDEKVETVDDEEKAKEVV